MTILGIGIDIVNVKRIDGILEKYKTRFINKIFSENEQKKCEKAYNKGAAYAKRFAAKEAYVKALGIGIAQGIQWRDICVENEKNGKPILTLFNKAKFFLHDFAPPEKSPFIHLSLTDDLLYAQAIVIIEAR